MILLPTRKPELLRLFLHVFIVSGGGFFRSHLAGANGNTELLERRTLDGREELQRGGGLASIDVCSNVFHRRKDAVRQRRVLDHVGTCWRDGCIERVNASRRGDEAQEILSHLEV